MQTLVTNRSHSDNKPYKQQIIVLQFPILNEF